MSQAAPPLFPSQSEINKRRYARFPIAVPVDVVALRSGIPATIPGRSVEVSEGGVSAVLSGELRSGEWVGVSFKLPFVIEPVQAKAMVRYHSPLRCGLQFYAMPSEQQGALRTWTRIAAEGTPRTATATERVQREVSRPAHDDDRPRRTLVRRRRTRSRRWLWIVPIIVIAAVLGWLWWHDGWESLGTGNPETSATQPKANVPGTVMEQRLVHKVDPVYPPNAVRSKLQGVVTLDVIVGEDGVVKDLHATSGPDELARSALEAVKWWRFQPYEVDGKPAAVETTIEVEFRL